MTQTKPAARLGPPQDPPVAGLRARFLVDDADYEPVAALIRDCHEHDGVPWLPTADIIRLDMRREGIDPTRDAVLVDLEGALVAVLMVERQVRDGVPVYDIWGKVRPSMRRRGIGRWLVDWGLDRSTRRAAGEDPEGAVLLGAEVEEHEDGARILFEASGFVPVRQFFLMQRRNLDDIPDVPLPAGLEIRPVEPAQHRTIFDAENEAFRDHWGHHEPDEEAFRQTYGQAETNTDLWAVAWDGDQVAGVVQSWIWPEENRRLGVRRGWLERISVRRPWRRRGLGEALTADALRKLHAVGLDEAMLGVDAENPTGALGLYERLGFVVTRRSTAYRRPLER